MQQLAKVIPLGRHDEVNTSRVPLPGGAQQPDPVVRRTAADSAAHAHRMGWVHFGPPCPICNPGGAA